MTIKCKVCDYGKSEDWENEDGKPRGNKSFIEIKGIEFKVDAEMRWGEQSKPVYLYACPECGTVRMENW